MMNYSLGQVHFWLTFIGVYMVFVPLHYIGIAGFPRRYYAFTNYAFTSKFVDMNEFIMYAAILTFLAQLIFLYNFISSIFYGKKAPKNPWRSNTLEWTTPVHPGHGNWPGDLPAVYRWPYDYSKPGSVHDFIPQNVPLSDTPKSNLPHENELIENEKLLEQQYFNDPFRNSH